MSVETIVYSILNVRDQDRENSIGFLNELIHNFDIDRCSVEIVDGNINYPKEHEGLERRAYQNLSEGILDIAPLIYYLSGFENTLKKTEPILVTPGPHEEKEDIKVKMVLTGNKVKYSMAGKVNERAIWGCSPFIREFHKKSIWHETLHEFGVSYREDWGGNCTNDCLMNYVPRKLEICPSCYSKLHEFLEPHQKVRIIKTTFIK